MADQNTSLPIRSEADGSDERLHVKIVDGTNPAVNQATVDSDKNLHVLAEGHDPSSAARALRTSELGALTPDGLYSVTDNTKPGNVGLVASSRTASPSDATQTERLTSKQGTVDTTVRALDTSLHDASGNAFSASNPLPVSVADAIGTPVTDYKDAAATAAGASDNHDYSITASKVMHLKSVIASASGKMKATLQTSSDGTIFSTVAVGFNSTANPNVVLTITNDMRTSGTGSKIRVIMKNLDNQAQDLYSTILGIEE